MSLNIDALVTINNKNLHFKFIQLTNVYELYYKPHTFFN